MNVGANLLLRARRALQDERPQTLDELPRGHRRQIVRGFPRSLEPVGGTVERALGDREVGPDDEVDQTATPLDTRGSASASARGAPPPARHAVRAAYCPARRARPRARCPGATGWPGPTAWMRATLRRARLDAWHHPGRAIRGSRRGRRARNACGRRAGGAPVSASVHPAGGQGLLRPAPPLARPAAQHDDGRVGGDAPLGYRRGTTPGVARRPERVASGSASRDRRVDRRRGGSPAGSAPHPLFGARDGPRDGGHAQGAPPPRSPRHPGTDERAGAWRGRLSMVRGGRRDLPLPVSMLAFSSPNPGRKKTGASCAPRAIAWIGRILRRRAEPTP